MSDEDNLEKEALEMFEQIRAKLDNPTYLFSDGTDEAWCRQLREYAARCRAVGHDFWERQLETAARDVEERGGDWE